MKSIALPLSARPSNNVGSLPLFNKFLADNAPMIEKN